MAGRGGSSVPTGGSPGVAGRLCASAQPCPRRPRPPPPRSRPSPPRAKRRGRPTAVCDQPVPRAGALPRPSPAGPCPGPEGREGPARAALSRQRGGRNGGAGPGERPEGRRADRGGRRPLSGSRRPGPSRPGPRWSLQARPRRPRGGAQAPSPSCWPRPRPRRTPVRARKWAVAEGPGFLPAAARSLPGMERAPQGTFHDELEWCISQLEADLLRLSPAPKQAEEAQHILKVLRSSETPFVEKKQVMNRVFGNYRLRMAEDQKSMEKTDVKPSDVEVQQSSGQALDGKRSDSISEAKAKWFMSSDNSFRFDFTLSETDLEGTGTSLEAVPGVSGAEQIQTNVRAADEENWNGPLTFAAPGQQPEFTFNFAIPDEDCPPVPLVPASQHTESTAGLEALGNSLPNESAGTQRISALQKPELTQTAGGAPKEDRSHVTLEIPQPETAPEDEAVAETSKADGAAQKKKKKKKKQKPSVSKKEIEETGINRKAEAEANGCQNRDTSHKDETSQQSDDQLWKEVEWCVEQLELGLKTQKPTPKQAEEALRAIRTLRSDKAPLVKKRQLMRTMFGDYRKKMEEEWCREVKLMEKAAKSARVVGVKGNIRNKNCQFIRKCSAACRKSQSSESPGTLTTDSFKFTPSQEFRFNFF